MTIIKGPRKEGHEMEGPRAEVEWAAGEMVRSSAYAITNGVRYFTCLPTAFAAVSSRSTSISYRHLHLQRRLELLILHAHDFHHSDASGNKQQTQHP